MSRVENNNSYQQHDFMFHHLPVFLSFFPCLGIFYQASAFSKMTKIFILFIKRSDFFILFFSSHITSHIRELSTLFKSFNSFSYLLDLYRFVRFDFRFARRPMVLPVRALPFSIAFGEGKFMVHWCK